MKKIILFLFIVVLFFSSQVLAEYSSNIKIANKAYSAGLYSEALKYYKLAYNEKQDAKLKMFMDEIEKIISKLENQEQLPISAEPMYDTVISAKEAIRPAAVLIVVSDIVLTGLMAYAYFDYNDTVDKYNVLFSQYDNTSNAEYLRMMAEYDKVGSKQNLFVISGSLAGAAILYTFLDVFIFHAAFPVDVALDINQNRMQIRTALNKEF